VFEELRRFSKEFLQGRHTAAKVSLEKRVYYEGEFVEK
jgi:hypothetical protein